MTRSNLARVRVAYELAHMRAGLRGVLVAAGLAVLAVGLHRTTHATWLVTGVLAITLAVFGWRGGAARRGAAAGVLAGLPPMLAPGALALLKNGGHCASCAMAPSLTCVATCFLTSAVVGIIVGQHATRDASPPRFAGAAIVSAALTGALGCGTTGLGGALGVVVGLVAGGFTGWLVSARAA